MDARSFVSCQEFDETLEKRQRGPGCGKKHSTQAMLRHLARQVQELKLVGGLRLKHPLIRIVNSIYIYRSCISITWFNIV